MPNKSRVRQFNEDIRKLFRGVERRFGISRRDYGVLWCDEFGGGNTNLHAHGFYCGPSLSEKELSRLWAEIRGDGSYIVSIKPARSFGAGLSHCLKYPSKFFDASPARLVELELAFDRVRRVHAVSAFYNPKIEREPGEDAGMEEGRCPVCGDLLVESARSWAFVDQLKREGRKDLDSERMTPAARMREHGRRCLEAVSGSGSP